MPYQIYANSVEEFLDRMVEWAERRVKKARGVNFEKFVCYPDSEDESFESSADDIDNHHEDNNEVDDKREHSE